MNGNKVKKILSGGVELVIVGVVCLFLGMKSIDFFLFTTPADKWYYAYLGFGLTGGGVFAYLIMFMWSADTDLKKTVAIVMLGVCIIGELATAGFGLQIDAWRKIGYTMTDSDLSAMILAVQILGFAHAIAMITYVAGDRITAALGDEDKDGIRNYKDADYKKKNDNVGFKVNGADAETIAQLRAEIERLSKQPPKA